VLVANDFRYADAQVGAAIVWQPARLKDSTKAISTYLILIHLSMT